MVYHEQKEQDWREQAAALQKRLDYYEQENVYEQINQFAGRISESVQKRQDRCYYLFNKRLPVQGYGKGLRQLLRYP